MEWGRLDESVEAYRCALELKPDYPEAHNNLGAALRRRGQLDDAVAAIRRALEIRPEYACAHSNLISSLHVHPEHDAKTIVEEHQRWNRQFGEPLKRFILPHANERSVERRLRVGYVSPDFRDHPVGRYILPLFERHDPKRFEILCYSGVAPSDWMTERLRA
jgi:predicted O-linked N-acetylglucosamine transferase (SPINDLY family)